MALWVRYYLIPATDKEPGMRLAPKYLSELGDCGASLSNDESTFIVHVKRKRIGDFPDIERYSDVIALDPPDANTLVRLASQLSVETSDIPSVSARLPEALKTRIGYRLAGREVNCMSLRPMLPDWGVAERG